VREQGEGREEAVKPMTLFGGGPNGRLTGHDTVKMGEECFFDLQGPITIGPETFLGHRVMVLTGQHNMFLFGAERLAKVGSRPVTIGRGVWICSGAIICPGVTIGDHAVVGPGAVVMRNVRPYTVVAGNPARFVRRLPVPVHVQ